MKLPTVLAMLLAVLVVGCSSDNDGSVDPAGFVALGDSDAPKGCQPDDVGRLVIGFFEAFDTGNIATQVDDFVAPATRFGWFSVQGVGERLNEVAKDRDSLGDYLQRQADAGERFRLIAMDTEYDRARNITHIAYNVERNSPDSPDGRQVVVGKGAIDCESGKITVSSMGTFDGGPQTLCPSALAADHPTLPTVCVRESHET